MIYGLVAVSFVLCWEQLKEGARHYQPLTNSIEQYTIQLDDNTLSSYKIVACCRNENIIHFVLQFTIADCNGDFPFFQNREEEKKTHTQKWSNVKIKLAIIIQCMNTMIIEVIRMFLDEWSHKNKVRKINISRFSVFFFWIETIIMFILNKKWS